MLGFPSEIEHTDLPFLWTSTVNGAETIDFFFFRSQDSFRASRTVFKQGTSGQTWILSWWYLVIDSCFVGFNRNISPWVVFNLTWMCMALYRGWSGLFISLVLSPSYGVALRSCLKKNFWHRPWNCSWWSWTCGPQSHGTTRGFCWCAKRIVAWMATDEDIWLNLGWVLWFTDIAAVHMPHHGKNDRLSFVK